MSAMSPYRAGRALLRAIEPLAGSHTLLAMHSRDWASALFEGARHRLALVLGGADAASRASHLQAMLAEAELDYPGGFVADVEVVARMDGEAPVLAIEALTIEDPEYWARADRAAPSPRRRAVSCGARRVG